MSGAGGEADLDFSVTLRAVGALDGERGLGEVDGERGDLERSEQRAEDRGGVLQCGGNGGRHGVDINSSIDSAQFSIRCKSL